MALLKYLVCFMLLLVARIESDDNIQQENNPELQPAEVKSFEKDFENIKDEFDEDQSLQDSESFARSGDLSDNLNEQPDTNNEDGEEQRGMRDNKDQTTLNVEDEKDKSNAVQEQDSEKRTCRYRCGGYHCYDPRVKKCCYGRLILRGQLCCQRGFRKCGRHCYNRSISRCCLTKIVPLRILCPKFGYAICRRVYYKPSVKKCCRGRVIPLRAVCRTYGYPRCGRRRYNPRVYKCCYGRITFKRLRCVRYLPCGRRRYNPRVYKCCNGIIVNKYARCGYSGLG